MSSVHLPAETAASLLATARESQKRHRRQAYEPDCGYCRCSWPCPDSRAWRTVVDELERLEASA